MEATKAGVMVANGIGDQERVNQTIKIGGEAIGAVTSLASQNFPGAVLNIVSTGIDSGTALVKNANFIGKEFDKMKQWDETHNKDGSLKKPQMLILMI